MPKKTLKEIAQEANVSAAMVSQILNGTGRASKDVRQKISALLHENGYRPKIARYPFYYLVDLPYVESAGKTRNILQQLSGIERAFNEHNLTYHVEFIRTDPAVDQLKLILERKPSGVFINTDARFLDEACQMCATAGIPVVQIGYDTENPNYNAVVVDGFSGAYTGVKHLLQKGHTRIGIVRFLAGLAGVNSHKKFAGYTAALADAGLEVDKDLVREMAATQGEPGWQPARVLIQDLLALSDPPTAVFVENSFISLSLLYPLPSDDGQIPDSIKQLEFIHFEDWPLALAHDILSEKLFYPRFESRFICIDWESIGVQAAQLLIRQVNESSSLPEILRISPALVQIKGNSRQPIIQ
ncbi:LacI family DNA-binding transcriptional regulator [candidate division KSB1 bacterium]|nr:LacI family DNA-binding transcriptional regulator [candidate division KSB1 bacterium]